jgi:hypothetical protein
MKWTRLVFATAAALVLFADAANADCSAHHNENQCSRDPGCDWADVGSFAGGECVPMLQDICVEKIEDPDFGIVAGTINVSSGEKTFTIRNRSTETLTDVDLTLDLDGMQVNVLNKCGIDGGENGIGCWEETNLQIGDLVSLIRKALFYEMPDFNTDETHTFYIDSGVQISVALQERLYGSYVKDGVLFYGRIEQCSAGGGEDEPEYTPSGMDAIEPDYSYYSDRNITTKVMHKPFNLKFVLLDENGAPKTYDSPEGYEMPVLPTLCSDQHVLLLPNPNRNNPAPTFTNGDDVVTGHGLNVPQVHKNDRVRMQFLDWNQIMDWPTSPEQCVHKSSTSGNYNGIPQCLNSDTKLGDLFPAEDYPYVHDVCMGGTLDLLQGQVAPCTSSAYSGGSVNPAKTIVPAEYNHGYGCYQCLLDGLSDADICSSDTFASRPDRFDANLTEGIQLVAAKPVSIDFRALDYGGNPSAEYNETTADTPPSFAVSAKISDPSKVCDQPVIRLAPGVAFEDGRDLGQFKFDNVGDASFVVREINGSEFAIVDADDTPDDDRLIGEENVSIRILPNDFRIEAKLDDYDAAGFTYLYDLNDTAVPPADYNTTMATTLELNITARDFDGNTTTNYHESCYAKATDVNLTITPVTLTPSGALTRFTYYNPKEDSIKSEPISDTIDRLPIANLGASFSNDAADGRGTANIKYKLNFNRKVNKPVNPFKLALTNVHMADIDSVEGDTGTIGEAATFLFGRVHAPRYRVPCGDPSAACTSPGLKIYFEYYSDLDSNVPLRRTISSDDQRSKDGIVWFRNPSHETADGNITSVAQRYIATSPISEAGVTRNGATESRTFQFIPSTWGYPYKASMKVDANRWLIYNRFDENATYSTFALEFSAGAGNKAGTGDLGDGPGSAAAATTRRIRW